MAEVEGMDGAGLGVGRYRFTVPSAAGEVVEIGFSAPVVAGLPLAAVQPVEVVGTDGATRWAPPPNYSGLNTGELRPLPPRPAPAPRPVGVELGAGGEERLERTRKEETRRAHGRVMAELMRLEGGVRSLVANPPSDAGIVNGNVIWFQDVLARVTVSDATRRATERDLARSGAPTDRARVLVERLRRGAAIRAALVLRVLSEATP